MVAKKCFKGSSTEIMKFFISNFKIEKKYFWCLGISLKSVFRDFKTENNKFLINYELGKINI